MHTINASTQLRQLSAPQRRSHWLTTAIAGGLAAALLPQFAWADSPRLTWSGNGHFYQRFNKGGTWEAAKTECEALNAHLATIASDAEQGFIAANLLMSGEYHIGGSYNTTDGVWQWVTGEIWDYTNWAPGEPSGNKNTVVISGSGAWYEDVYSYEGYICEWSYNTYVGSALVPDLNGNGADEFAALYVDPKTYIHTVKMEDPVSKKLFGKLTFPKGDEPSKGMVVINDIEGNGTPEIAVQYYTTAFGESIKVQIKDVMHNNTIVKTLVFLDSNYKPKSIGVSPDINGNGSSEIVILGLHKDTGRAKMEMRDSKTGKVLRSAVF